LAALCAFCLQKANIDSSGGQRSRTNANGLNTLPSAASIMYSFLYISGGTIPMDAITYTKARANLAQTIDSVCENHEPVIITKKNDRSVVMLSLEDFQALEETSYLLRNPKNARRLLDSVNELDSGGGAERALAE
jgi:antitoxin YefM